MAVAVPILRVSATLLSLVLVVTAQGYSQERYADSAPDNLIPSVPWPEWLPIELASVPNNIPHSPLWAPAAGGGGGGGGGEPAPQGKRNSNSDAVEPPIKDPPRERDSLPTKGTILDPFLIAVVHF